MTRLALSLLLRLQGTGRSYHRPELQKTLGGQGARLGEGRQASPATRPRRLYVKRKKKKACSSSVHIIIELYRTCIVPCDLSYLLPSFPPRIHIVYRIGGGDFRDQLRSDKCRIGYWVSFFSVRIGSESIIFPTSNDRCIILIVQVSWVRRRMS